MAASVDYRTFSAVPHRRPLPSNATPHLSTADQFSHSRTRTTSSNVLPSNAYPNYLPSASTMTVGSTPQPYNRRTLSNATTSTTASSTASYNAPVPARATGPPSNYASSIRRSTSSRSGASTTSTSYVALLRKQKATVWCDRAQHEDPRLLQQQRAAKARAQAEMVGKGSASSSLVGRQNNSSTGLTGGVRSKIRHHGAVKASAYSGGLGTSGNLSGAGVPMRLSASEVDDEQNSENGEDALDRRYHQRNGSGRSSLGSQHRTQSGYFSVNGAVGTVPGGAGGSLQMSTIHTRSSNGSTPPSAHSPVETRRNSLPLSQMTTEEETPMPESSRSDYFAQSGGNGGSGGSSRSSEERFGDVGQMRQHFGVEQQQFKKTSDELRRRGSVDDRTTTMSGVRLFVANPDLDD